jgi:nitrite reductase (NO-forming)
MRAESARPQDGAMPGRSLLACALAFAGLVAPCAAPAAVVPVHLTARDAVVRVAPGVRMRAWTFNGRMPGPTIRVREGDVVEVTLRNRVRPPGHGAPAVWHSVDFHAAQIAPNSAFVSVAPGKQHTFSFVASHPGVYLYHCGTGPMLEHIGMGMYGAIIVDPAAGRPPAQEVVLVQSELYGSVRHGWLRPSLRAMRRDPPRFVVFNGQSMRYSIHPIAVPVGQPVRVYLADAGPTIDSDFHVVGTIFDTVEPDGNPQSALHGVSTQLVPAGGAAVFELTFPQPGMYPFVSHSMRSADAGAMGHFAAQAGPSAQN